MTTAAKIYRYRPLTASRAVQLWQTAQTGAEALRLKVSMLALGVSLVALALSILALASAGQRVVVVNNVRCGHAHDHDCHCPHCGQDLADEWDYCR